MIPKQIQRCRFIGLVGAIIFLGLGLVSRLGATGQGSFLDLYGTALLALMFAAIWMLIAVWPYPVDNLVVKP